jgi:hypothetical protein
MRYFIAGNIWLFTALAIFLLKHAQRYNPTRVSFLEEGKWFTPIEYNSINIIVLLIGLIFFELSRRSDKNN